MNPASNTKTNPRSAFLQATFGFFLSLALLFSFSSVARADSVRDLQYWLKDYGIEQAWKVSKGAGITVAVIDSGVVSSHPSLKAAVIGGKDFSGLGSPDGSKPVGNSPEHGTLVASILAGRGEGNNAGLIGVAPEAKILAASVGFGTGGDVDQQIADAVVWAVDQGAQVINLSLTRNRPEWPLSWDKAFKYAFEKDVVVVAAAGNRSSGTASVGAPATIPGVLTVAGVDRDGLASLGSSTQGATITVSAPSEELVGALPEGWYATWSGTSGAAPIVSGIVALIRSAYPNATAGEVIGRLKSTAKDAGDRIIYGAGLVDAAAALSEENFTAEPEPAATFAEWVRIHRADTEELADDPVIALPDAGTPPVVTEPLPDPGASFWQDFFSPQSLRETVIPIGFFVIVGLGLAFVVIFLPLRYLVARNRG